MLPNRKYAPQDVVKIVRKRLPFLIVPTAVGLLAALTFSSRLPNIYQAETLIQIVPQRVPDTYVRSTVTIRTEDRLEALGQQVMSRTQLERMILDLNLYPAERTVRPMQDVVEKMRLDVNMQTVRPSRMEPVDAFYLRYKYGDPVMAARVTERLGLLYIDFNARERGALAEGANNFLETQLAEAKARLEQHDKKMQTFRERHAGKLPSQLQYNMQAIQSTQLQRQAVVESLARDRDRKLMLERLYNDAVSAPLPAPPAAPEPVAADSTAAATMPLQRRLELAKTELSRLEQRLTQNHPDLKRARKIVADLEQQVASAQPSTAAAPTASVTNEELSRQERISNMRAELESLDRQILFKEQEDRRLSGVIADYQNRIESVPGVESEWLSLTRDYESMQAAFQDLLTKSESARVAAELETRQIGEQFRVLDAPRIPTRPISPPRPIITAAGIAAGFFVGLLMLAVAELRDSSLRTELDVQQVLQLPVIALVPDLVTSADRTRLRFRRALAFGGYAAALIVGVYLVWAMKLWNFVA